MLFLAVALHCVLVFPYDVNNLTCDVPHVANTKPMSRTATQMCLGTKADENFNWCTHVKMICTKARAGNGVMKLIKPFVPKHTIESVYESLVLPYFDY